MPQSQGLAQALMGWRVTKTRWLMTRQYYDARIRNEHSLGAQTAVRWLAPTSFSLSSDQDSLKQKLFTQHEIIFSSLKKIKMIS